MPETPSHQADHLTQGILVCYDRPGFRADVLGQGVSLRPLQTWMGVHPVTLPTVMNQLHAHVTVQS